MRRNPLDVSARPRHPAAVRHRLALVLASLALVACKSATELSLDITAGQEKDAFSADPPVTKIDVVVTSLDGSVNAAVSTTPGGTFDLGNLPSDAQVNIEVTGFDAANDVILRGRSLSGLALDGITGDVPVFVQRTGAWARPPGGLLQTHVGGVAATLGERYLLVTGGAAATDPKQLDAYDILSLGGAKSAALPRLPTTLVSLGDTLLLIDDTGASWVDYTNSTSHDATLPAGLASFGDVAGGTPVLAGDGTTYVVGGTRRGEPTTAVLAVASDGTLSSFTTMTARKGAAAVWIDTVGLVIAGGSGDGPGVEVLADGATAFAARGFDADPVEGAGASLDGGKGLVLVGGSLGGAAAPTRLLDPTCVVTCAAKELAEATLPAPFEHVSAYSLEGSKLLVVGDEIDGMKLTRAFTVNLTDGVTELPLREPRRGARPLPTPTAHLAIVGGEHPDGTPATSIELLFTK